MSCYTVTGGTGFIGRSLVAYLLDGGHQVITPLRSQSFSRTPNGAEFVDSENLDELTSAIQGSDCIFHLATLFKGSHAPSDVRDMVDANVRMTAVICEASHNARVNKLVYTESVAQHVGGILFSATSLYAATKQSGTDILRYYASIGLKAICVTIPDTLGPDDNRGKLLSLLQRAVTKDLSLQMSPGRQLVDYLFVTDVVTGLVQAANYLNDSVTDDIEFFRLSSGNLITLQSFVELVQQYLQTPLHIEWGAHEYRPGEMFEQLNWPPILKGWRPIVDLRSAIKYSLSVD